MTDTTATPPAMPAGQTPGQPARAERSNFRNPKTLTTVVSVLLVIGMVVNAAAVISDAFDTSLLSQADDGLGEMPLVFRALIIVLQAALLFITAVPFLMWVFRANSNAHALGAAAMKFRPGWSVGWFFVPIMSLWRPYQVMREIWQASANPGGWSAVPVPPILGWWWALYLIHSILSQAIYRGIDDAAAYTAGEAVFSLAVNAVGVAANIAAFRLVRKIAANQIWQSNIAQVF